MSSHKDQYLDYQENTKQKFLCLQTKIRYCDHFTLYFIIVPEKFHKKTLPKSLLHRIKNMDYTLENITEGEPEQTSDLFIEQTRSWTAEGEPGEENGSNEHGGYCQEWGRNSQRV